MDIAFPRNNEKRFSEMASRLGIEVKFAYPSKELFKVDNLFVSDKGTRKDFEEGRIKMFFDLEKQHGKDFLHQRNSGLNHIMVKIASEKNKMIGFNFSGILNAEDEKKAVLLGRMKQNVKLCRKYKVKMFLGSFAKDPYELRSIYELRAFGVIIGMNPGEIKNSVFSDIL